MAEFIIKKPIMDLSIFKYYNFTMFNILGITRSVALIGSVFLMSMFFQNLMNYSVTTTGMMLIPQALALSIDYNSPFWYETFNKIKEFTVSKGSSFYSSVIASKGIFIGYYMRRWANVNAYDDAFFISALFVFASIVPSLMLKNIIYKKTKQPKETAAIEPD